MVGSNGLPEMCHCGISIVDSVLPEGWSVHRSQDEETKGRLFFVSPDNTTTSWSLPDRIVRQMDAHQRETLKRLRTGARVYGIANV